MKIRLCSHRFLVFSTIWRQNVFSTHWLLQCAHCHMNRFPIYFLKVELLTFLQNSASMFLERRCFLKGECCSSGGLKYISAQPEKPLVTLQENTPRTWWWWWCLNFLAIIDRKISCTPAVISVHPRCTRKIFFMFLIKSCVLLYIWAD